MRPYAICAALVACLATSARADDRDTEARVRAALAERDAEALAQAGFAERDPAKLVACGDAFRALERAAPSTPDGERWLFNAGTCFEAALATPAASEAFAQLRAAYPHSVLVGKALVHLARLAEAEGQLGRAADLLEDYAHRFPGERDAEEAQRTAFGWRVALGDDARAIANATAYARTYRRGAAIADLMYALVPVYARRADGAAPLGDLARLYGTELGPARVSVVLATAAGVAWDRTCGGRALCVSELPAGHAPRCTAGPRLRVDPRGATAEAEAALARAAQYFEEHAPEDAAARHAYAMTKLRQGDRDLEAYLAVDLPGGLDFSPAARGPSTQRVAAWFAQKEQLGTAAARRYATVLALRDPEATVAAAARLGQLAAGLATAVRTSQIPVDVRTGPAAPAKTAAFCSALADAAASFVARARETLTACRAKAAELGVDGEWPAVCERELARLEPGVLAEEPRLGALVPVAPPPPFSPPPAPTALDTPAYADALSAAAQTPCPRLPAAQTPHGKYLAALVAARCGRLDEARRAWAELPGAAALASLGSALWRGGDPAGATAAWTRALALDRTSAAAHYGLALAELADPARAADAEQHLRLAAAAAPDASEARVLLALLALRAGRPALAALELAHVTTDAGPALVARALLLAQQGRWADVAAPLAAAAEERWPQARYDLALVALRRHDYAAAAAALEAVTPVGYELLLARGAAAAGLGKADEAATAYRAAIALDAARPEAHFDLGLALAAAGARAPAAAELRAAKADALAARLAP